MAGLPALQDGESGQVRKEAATANPCECRDHGSPPLLLTIHLHIRELCNVRLRVEVIRAPLKSAIIHS